MLIIGFFQPAPGWFAGEGWHPGILFYYVTLDAFALLLSVCFLCGLDGSSICALGLSIYSGWLRHAGSGLAWGTAVISAAALLMFVSRAAHIIIFASRSISSVLFLAAFLLLSSLFEELAFRGYALMCVADSLGPVVAALISSALFGFAHYANPQATLLSSLNTALAGVLLATARLRSRALWMPVALHFAWNFSLGAVFSFPVSGFTLGATRLSAPSPGPIWFTGGAYGPEASVLLTLALVVAIPLLLRYPLRCQPLPPAPNQS